jgi:hypothetical protein
MADYMNRGICDRVWRWRNEFLHSGVPTHENNRRVFWKDVITVARHELRPNSEIGQLMEIWLKQDPKQPKITNEEINQALRTILEGPVTDFIKNPITKKCLNDSIREFCGVSGRARATNAVVPFLFIVDEAAYLYETHYMHSFMWVLDQPIMSILASLGNREASNFFVLMLGTHSQISHFAPHNTYPSERYYTGEQFIPTVFLSLDWDTGLRASNGESNFNASSHIANLVRWGRPLWSAIYEGRLTDTTDNPFIDKMDISDLSKCVWYAEKKLLPGGKAEDEAEKDLSAFAVLAIRLHLDLDFVYPTRASKLVSSKMRWLVDVDPGRKHIVTTYGSEPLLVEGAALAMNSYRLFTTSSDPLVELLNRFKNQLNQGFVDRGENGELTARLLCTSSSIWFVLTLRSFSEGSSNSGRMVEGFRFHHCYL